jgi:phosphatidylserine decarboxylase
MVTLLESDHFGRVAMIEVGAFTIGSIQQRYQPGARVKKGDHKGFFELGGSIVILLFEKGAVRFDDDLCTNTSCGIETYVRLGESIGRA